MPGAASSPFALTGRLALVTGASGGLGFAIARSLAAAGAEVLVNGRDPARAEAAAAQLRSDGGAATALPFDAGDAAAAEAAVASVVAGRGRLDILVGTVGHRHRAPMGALPPEDFRHLLEVNLTASYALARAALPAMRQQGWGRIILVASIAGPIARAGDAAYTAAKGGLAALVRALAVEWGGAGITSNGIAPGFFATEANRALIGDPEVTDFLQRRCPLGRWGEPAEIGGAAVFLASEAASYVNGQVLSVDGGLSVSF